MKDIEELMKEYEDLCYPNTWENQWSEEDYDSELTVNRDHLDFLGHEDTLDKDDWDEEEHQAYLAYVSSL